MVSNAKEVLRYFVRNTHAADTLEGVARWRLTEERVHRTVEEINEVLDWLVAEGILLKESAQGSRAIFRLNPRKAAEAARLLADLEKS